MKTLFTTLITLVIFSSNAQLLEVPASLTINEGTMLLEKVERNGFSIGINGEGKEVMKQFGDYTEETWGVKVKSRSEKVTGEDLLSTSFSDKHFNIHAYFVESDQGNELRLFISFGTDIFVNSTDYSQESINCKNHLRGFAKKYYGDYVNGQIEEKKDVLAKSQKTVLGIKKDISKTEKSKLKAQKAIEKLEKANIKNADKIRQYQEKITENEAEIVTENSSIESLDKENEAFVVSQEKVEKSISESTADLAKLEKMLGFVKNF